MRLFVQSFVLEYVFSRGVVEANTRGETLFVSIFAYLTQPPRATLIRDQHRPDEPLTGLSSAGNWDDTFDLSAVYGLGGVGALELR